MTKPKRPNSNGANASPAHKPAKGAAVRHKKPVASSNEKRGASWLEKVLADDKEGPLVHAELTSGIENPTHAELARTLTIDGENIRVYDISRDVLVDLIDGTALRILAALNDEEKLKKASVQQLATSYGILFDKSRLMRGEPTAIYRHEDERKLNELGKALVEQMEMRGISLEGEVVEETDDEQGGEP